MSKFCTECGNTGLLLDGTVCECGIMKSMYDESVICLTIPEQYRGIQFNEANVTKESHASYPIYLSKLYTSITQTKLRNKNIYLASPKRSSKTILAYSCIQNLFRREIPTFPLMDTGEIRSIMNDLDRGKDMPTLLKGMDVEPLNLYNAPYLFVKVTDSYDFATYDTMALLIDRRTRRGGSTIFLSNNSWQYFVAGDKNNKVSVLMGDGAFGTIENKSFWKGDDTV